MNSRKILPNGNRRLRKSILFVTVCFTLIFVVTYYLDLLSSRSIEPQFFHQPKYTWKPEYGELNGPDISDKDPRVLTKLRTRYLIPPDLENAYNLSLSEGDDPSIGQGAIIRKVFGALKNEKLLGKKPFFVECGALDGETRSNTLYMEMYLNWEGLLIEADPSNYGEMVLKRRKAWLSPTCLSTKPHPMMVSFEQKVNQGKIAGPVGYIQRGFVDSQCFPFNTYMEVLNRTLIHYFSLDVEGVELDILKTIDFEKFNILTLSVEFIHGAEGKFAIKDFMEKKGYLVLTEVTHGNWLANDFIFLKKSLLEFLPENFVSGFNYYPFPKLEGDRIVNEDPTEATFNDDELGQDVRMRSPKNSIFTNRKKVHTFDDFD